jgi:hypothetical protein
MYNLYITVFCLPLRCLSICLAIYAITDYYISVEYTSLLLPDGLAGLEPLSLLIYLILTIFSLLYTFITYFELFDLSDYVEKALLSMRTLL